MSTADVRSLLRSERKARRIEHPHAAYNAAGVLSCQLCHIQIKAESLWNQHLRGSHHRGQLQRQRAAQASKAVAVANSDSNPQKQASAGSAKAGVSFVPAEPAGTELLAGNKRKRKADDEDDEDEPAEAVEDARTKKPRPALRAQVPLRSPSGSRTEPPAVSLTEAAAPSAEEIDEAEWDAFTREVASPPPATKAPPPAVAASATITAAPVTAAEIAARSREDESRQTREKKDAEMQDEQDDAADRIAEEIEEQELLLERVNKWKERREALRHKAAGGPDGEPSAPAQAEESGGVEEAVPGSESSDDDDDEDFDGWGMLRG